MKVIDLEEVNAARIARKAVVRIIDLTDGTNTIIRGDEPHEGRFAEAVRLALQNRQSGLVEIEGRRYFLNVYLPSPHIVVIGAVHISQALAPMARIAGFNITIIDPRTAFATPARFEATYLCAEWPYQALAVQSLDS